MSTTFLYQALENRLQAYTSFSRTGFAALELDPAFVKAIYARHFTLLKDVSAHISARMI